MPIGTQPESWNLNLNQYLVEFPDNFPISEDNYWKNVFKSSEEFCIWSSSEGNVITKSLMIGWVKEKPSSLVNEQNGCCPQCWEVLEVPHAQKKRLHCFTSSPLRHCENAM